MKVKIDIKVEPKLEQRIRTDAQTEGRNFSAQIRWMLESYYKGKDPLNYSPYENKGMLREKLNQ